MSGVQQVFFHFFHIFSIFFPRNWSEYDMSPVYDLHLLRWETQLQLQVGKSIVSAWTELGKTAAKVSLPEDYIDA